MMHDEEHTNSFLLQLLAFKGPLIHIGAIMGASCTKLGGLLQNFLIRWNSRHDNKIRGYQFQKPNWSERVLSWTLQELSHFATDAERRDLVSIGASVGFAASFGSPIGGLLFILDDVSCYFERRLLLRMLIGNAIGTFCLALKHRDMSNFGIINMGTFNSDDIFEMRLLETPLYILVGIGGGVLGGFFCAGNRLLRQYTSSRFPEGKGRAKYQLFEVAIVSIFTSTVLFYLPTASWACKSIPRDVPASILANYQLQENKRFFCPKGKINEMAAVMFGSRITAIKDILADPTSYQTQTLWTIGAVFYLLTLISFGCGFPCGLFTPTILVGAALGGAVGNIFKQYVDEDIFPSTFALLGVASMLAGIQRSTVSVAVILVEGTGQIKVLLPVIWVVVLSRYVAQNIEYLGIFEAAIAKKKYPYLEHEKIPRYFDAVTVKNILTEQSVLCLEAYETVGNLVDVLAKSSYESFPVVESESRNFLGLVKRQQIAALLECGIFAESKITQPQNNDSTYELNDNDEALRYWAYCINDDRYAHILSLPEEELIHSLLHNRQDGQLKDCHGRPILTKEQENITRSMRLSLRQRSTSLSIPPSELFCAVNRNETGNIVISWMRPEYNEYWVNLGAAANRGTCTVTEFMPVSKAYSMCK